MNSYGLGHSYFSVHSISYGSAKWNACTLTTVFTYWNLILPVKGRNVYCVTQSTDLCHWVKNQRNSNKTLINETNIKIIKLKNNRMKRYYDRLYQFLKLIIDNETKPTAEHTIFLLFFGWLNLETMPFCTELFKMCG
jgi:hypothetical protein